ncbi:uncharacterized protein AMSG_05014 [Thecamonas trahens ATCC 50062]|uniref:Uncharacterized protein n=1 Tax=Thecamonas trahens ATCC 50062 TaxID=461836 RepID=A0A0L0D9Y1_THETB|nr:hypothetical protein AMSG_05014 [Thecamonas trahens ATCC 50062]KNC49055.1 hypothetical protein AMSG_05014 [Thecamonas trahens ATCC 50062]|eukprot:XP_013758088.1 hypothetical protein AMSG_05014 [Thecamonas trahens ATCC 50062]
MWTLVVAIVVAAVVPAAVAAEWQVETVYSGAGCTVSGNTTALGITAAYTSNCVGATCSQIGTSGRYYQRVCTATEPTTTGFDNVMRFWSSSPTCAGNPTSMIATMSTCAYNNDGTSNSLALGSSTVSAIECTDAACGTCSGAATIYPRTTCGAVTNSGNTVGHGFANAQPGSSGSTSAAASSAPLAEAIVVVATVGAAIAALF